MGISCRRKPPCQRHLLPSIELDTLGSLYVEITEKRLIPTGKRKPCHRRWNTHVDADHPSVEMLFELPSRMTIPSKN